MFMYIKTNILTSLQRIYFYIHIKNEKKANYGSVQKAYRNSTPHLNLKELHIGCLIFFRQKPKIVLIYFSTQCRKPRGLNISCFLLYPSTKRLCSRKINLWSFFRSETGVKNSKTIKNC